MRATKKRGRPAGSRAYPSPEYEKRYRELESEGLRPHQIRSALTTEFGDLEDARNIERWVREDRSLDRRSPPWRVSMTPPEDVPAVFAAIAAAIEASHARIRWVSEAEAAWIVRVSKLGEGVNMTPREVYGAARRLARSDARDPSDYAEDVLLGVATDLLPTIDLGSASDLREWIERGPRNATSNA